MKDRNLLNIKSQIEGHPLDIQYLHLQLLRIDLIIRATVMRYQAAGQDFSEKFRGLFVSDDYVNELMKRPIGGNWGIGIKLPEGEEDLLCELEKKVVEEIELLRKEAQKKHYQLRLDQLKERFKLTDFEFDGLFVCMAPVLDIRYERIYGYLQDDVTNKYATIGLIFDLLLAPGLERIHYFCYFDEFASLIKNGLLKKINASPQVEQPKIKQNYIASQEIISWVSGVFQPVLELSSAIHYSRSVESPEWYQEFIDIPFDLSNLMPEKPILLLFGQDELQQHMIANYLSATLDRPILQLDLRKLDPSMTFNRQTLDLFLRDAILTQSIPKILGWERLSEDQVLQNQLIQIICDYDDIVIFVNSVEWQLYREENMKMKPFVRLKCDLPNTTQRFQMWKRYLVNRNGITNQELEMLAGQFSLTASQIQNSTFSASDMAFQENRPLIIDDLYRAARQYSSSHLNSLAIKIEPRYGWTDIVLPHDEMASLREIANTIRWRSVVLEDWGVGERLMPYSGLSALFSGPPGTGKTLAAQVIAAALKMDLYKIDLSTVVSKYIGETEKNLERIFSQAKNSNAILFFDEADSIFGKRSEVKDAHDRYANIEVGYLLQRMETYDGVVILATNLRSNLDEAFTRRLQFMVDFPFPDEAERLRIWQVLFPPGVPKSDDIDFTQLAERFRLTGGSIRNVIIGASFLAASEGVQVSTGHLLHAIRREMQKMGRLVNQKDLSITKKEESNGKNAK